MTIIGEGSYGFVFRPPLDHAFDDKYVSKIGKREDIHREYITIQKLPDDFPFIDKSKCHFYSSVSNIKKPSNLKPYLEELWDNDKMAMLVMPYIGADFLVYMLKFKSIFEHVDIFGAGEEHSANGKIMTVVELKKIMGALRKLHLDICIFNKLNFYHRDIKANNLFYNADTGKFILADYGISLNIKHPETFVHKYSRKLEYQDQIDFLENVLYRTLCVALNNAYIYDEIYELIIELDKTILDFRNVIKTVKKTVEYPECYGAHIVEKIYRKIKTLDDRKNPHNKIMMGLMPKYTGKPDLKREREKVRNEMEEKKMITAEQSKMSFEDLPTRKKSRGLRRRRTRRRNRT